MFRQKFWNESSQRMIGKGLMYDLYISHLWMALFTWYNGWLHRNEFQLKFVLSKKAELSNSGLNVFCIFLFYE